MKRRSILVGGMVAALVLSACGGDRDADAAG